jgi:hypothetical protein
MISEAAKFLSYVKDKTANLSIKNVYPTIGDIPNLEYPVCDTKGYNSTTTNEQTGITAYTIWYNFSCQNPPWSWKRID